MNSDDRIKVYDWRLRCLRDAGYDSQVAAILAREYDIDLHALVDAKKNGCTDDQALRMFM